MWVGLNTILAVGPLKLKGVSRGGCLSVCVCSGVIDGVFK